MPNHIMRHSIMSSRKKVMAPVGLNTSFSSFI